MRCSAVCLRHGRPGCPLLLPMAGIMGLAGNAVQQRRPAGDRLAVTVAAPRAHGSGHCRAWHAPGRAPRVLKVGEQAAGFPGRLGTGEGEIVLPRMNGGRCRFLPNGGLCKPPSFCLRSTHGNSRIKNLVDGVFLRFKEVIKHQGDNGVNTDDAPILNSDQAAVFLGLSYCKLNRYRSIADGSVFNQFGHSILYPGVDQEAWAAERRITPTSNDVSNWHSCPNAGEGGTGPAADPSHGTEAPKTNEKDASHG